MKRFFIAGIMVLFSCIGIFAQNWTVDGGVSFRNESWDYGTDTTTSSLDITVGYYFAEDLNIGLYGMYSKPTYGSTFAIGPRVKYDFLKFEKIYFSLFGWVEYVRFLESFTSGNNHYDATRIFFDVRPTVFFQISKNIEVYWEFAQVCYYYTWVTTINNNYTVFYLSGPWSDPTFGLLFRF